jgi:ornithine decarboxylase
MPPKIPRFLAQYQPATPCLVLDVERVKANFRAVCRALPLAYPLRGESEPRSSGADAVGPPEQPFDPASIEEVTACLDPGARPEAISFGNTNKEVAAIRRAHEAGVTMFAFDSREEWRSSSARPPAPECTAGSWWRMRALTDLCPASSARPSRTLGN